MTHKKRPITRRDFVKGAAGSAVAASILGPAALAGAHGPAMDGEHPGLADTPPADTPEPAPAKSTVVVVRDATAMDDDNDADAAVVAQMLETTVTAVTGAATAREAWLSLISPHDIVGMVGTSFMNATHDELFAGVRAALLDIGVPEVDVLDVSGGKPDKVTPCTALISMPALKGHWLTGIGTVLKNYIMSSGKPAEYHKEGSARLGEIWDMEPVKGKTKVVLVDALRPFCGKGPQPNPRYKWAYKGLIAGTDPVAVEKVCLEIIQRKRDAIAGEPSPISPPPICVDAADTVYGLGTADLAKIDVRLIGWDEEALLPG